MRLQQLAVTNLYSLPMTQFVEENKQILRAIGATEQKLKSEDAHAADAATSEGVSSVIHAVTGNDNPHWRFEEAV